MYGRLAALVGFALGVCALPLAVASCDDATAKRHSRTIADRAAAVPSDIVFYPHVLYGGDDAYLVEGRWYRPASEGWRVFTEEPLELELLRKTLEEGKASFLLP
jgi:hypothetical protein